MVPKRLILRINQLILYAVYMVDLDANSDCQTVFSNNLAVSVRMKLQNLSGGFRLEAFFLAYSIALLDISTAVPVELFNSLKRL